MNTNNTNNYLLDSNVLMLRISPDMKSIIIDFCDGNCSVARSVADTNAKYREAYLVAKSHIVYLTIAQKFITEIAGTKYDGMAEDENWFTNGFAKRCKDNDACNIRLQLPELNFTEVIPTKNFKHIQHGIDRISFNNFIVTYNLQFLLKDAYKFIGTYTIDKERNLKIHTYDWLIDAIKSESKNKGSKFNFNQAKKNITLHNTKKFDACIAHEIIKTQIKKLSAATFDAENKLADERVEAIMQLLNGNTNVTMPNEAVLEPTTAIDLNKRVNTLPVTKSVSGNKIVTEYCGNDFTISKKVYNNGTEFSVQSINGKSNVELSGCSDSNFDADDEFAIQMKIYDAGGMLTDEYQNDIKTAEFESLRYDEHKWYPRHDVASEPIKNSVVPERDDETKWSVNPAIDKVDKNNDFIDYESEPLNKVAYNHSVPQPGDDIDLIFTAVPCAHKAENDYSDFKDPLNIQLQQYREAHPEEFEPYVWHHEAQQTVKTTQARSHRSSK